MMLQSLAATRPLTQIGMTIHLQPGGRRGENEMVSQPAHLYDRNSSYA